MLDEEIVALYFRRNEAAIDQTPKKYGPYLSKIAYGILADLEDSTQVYVDYDSKGELLGCVPKIGQLFKKWRMGITFL